MRFISGEDFIEKTPLPIRYFYIIYPLAVVCCFGLGRVLEINACCEGLYSLIQFDVFTDRLDFYRQSSSKSIPYYLSTLVVFVPTCLTFWAIAASRYNFSKEKGESSGNALYEYPLINIIVTFLPSYVFLIFVPADPEGLGSLVMYPALPFFSIGSAWLSTAAFIQLLPLIPYRT